MAAVAVNRCRCFIRHAVTVPERTALNESISYFREIGDSRGLMISLMQLGACPSTAAVKNK